MSFNSSNPGDDQRTILIVDDFDDTRLLAQNLAAEERLSRGGGRKRNSRCRRG